MTQGPPDRGEVARAVAGAAATVPGVARLSPGWGVEVSTLVPGGRVVGVRLEAGAVSVHVVTSAVPIPPVAEAVRSAARAALDGLGDAREVHVVVDDLELGGDGAV